MFLATYAKTLFYQHCIITGSSDFRLLHNSESLNLLNYTKNYHKIWQRLKQILKKSTYMLGYKKERSLIRHIFV